MCQKPRHGARATYEAEVSVLSRSQYVEQFQQMDQSELPRRTEVSFLSFRFLSFLSFIIFCSYKCLLIFPKCNFYIVNITAFFKCF